MLRLLRLVEQFNELERGLEEGWTELSLQLTLENEKRAERTAALLSPANPGRFGAKIRFTVNRGGRGVGPEAVRRLLKRLDKERVDGTLELLRSQKAPAETSTLREPLREQWERRLAPLPADWSDLYAQVTLDSTDYLEPGALLLAPLNPARFGGAATAQGGGAADDHQGGILSRRHGRPQFPEHLVRRHQIFAVPTERRGQHGVLDGQGGDSRCLQLFDRAHDVQRIAIPVIGVHHERQIAPAGDAADLIGELRQGEDGEIRSSQDDARANRAGEHPDLEPQRLGHARRHGVEHRRRMNAHRAFEHLSIASPALSEQHGLPAGRRG